jgi:hypothetical protein
LKNILFTYIEQFNAVGIALGKAISDHNIQMITLAKLPFSIEFLAL